MEAKLKQLVKELQVKADERKKKFAVANTKLMCGEIKSESLASKMMWDKEIDIEVYYAYQEAVNEIKKIIEEEN